MPQDRPYRVTFLLLPGFPMACLTSAIEPLRAANEIAGRRVFDWVLTTENGQAAKASADVSFTPDHPFQNETRSDFTVVLAPPKAELAERATSAHLRRLAHHGAKIGAISGGVFVLGRYGLLDPDYRCSRHWCYEAAFEEEFPHIDASDDVLVFDRTRHTASGAAAGFEMMLSLIRTHLGEAVMTEVACWFQHPLVRTGDLKQVRPAFAAQMTHDKLPSTVARAIELFETHLSDLITIADVADNVGVSVRQLERQFNAAVGRSPTAHYRLVRLKAARQMVCHSNTKLSGIAAAVGFSKTAGLIASR
jgi:transcriptional regulator GlxA family with amidase domain